MVQGIHSDKIALHCRYNRGVLVFTGSQRRKKIRLGEDALDFTFIDHRKVLLRAGQRQIDRPIQGIGFVKKLKKRPVATVNI